MILSNSHNIQLESYFFNQPVNDLLRNLLFLKFLTLNTQYLIIYEEAQVQRYSSAGSTISLLVGRILIVKP
ncbi:MAG: hypothetical protein QG635_2175 [Bacteroidota bacterium]|nr:hypothetical protein [Bacteroidota bacterium]